MRLSFKIFLMTFSVLMTTFFLTFAVIELLLPRLYRREFVHDYNHLMANLQDELLAELEAGVSFQMAETMEMAIAADESLALLVERFEYWVEIYEQQCPDFVPDFEAVWDQSELHDLNAPSCELVWLEIAALDQFIEGYVVAEPVVHQPIEWFHFRQLRTHHEQYGSTHYLTIERILTEFAMVNNVRVIVWDMPLGFELGEVLFYIEGRSAEMEFMTQLDETELGVREQRFHNPATGGFAIAVSGTFQPAYRVLNIISTLQRQLLIAIFFVSLVISALFSIYLARPIVRLSEKSKRLRLLQFEHQSTVKRKDEIGDLSSNLNFMSQELKQTLDELQTANERLKIEMEREREQEQQRRDLFTSISHELKTPITILKGEIGGMIDEVGAYKDRDFYLDSAYGWTETLEKLVSEILTITRLEGEKMRLDVQVLNLSVLLDEVFQTHEALAKNRQVVFHNAVVANVCVHADKAQLQMALSNVVNNAIFYTQPGEMVRVSLAQAEGVATLSVTNWGAHIEEDALKHLFDPFYRIDKSRNRHTGGSGLGLFIVKNILELHGFDYAIENVEDGVCFTVDIPTHPD